jgi:superfamily II DNA or RNA helicase
MIKTELRGCQSEAVKAAVSILRGGGGFALFPEPRVGKTLTSLAIVDEVRPRWLVVICPKAAIAEWMRQIPEHLEADWPLEVTVVNYEQVVNWRKKWYKFMREGPDDIMIVCDESHYIKRRGTSRSRVVRKMARYAKYRLALTGTPIAQGIVDAWAQFDFIDPEIFGRYDDLVERDPDTKKIIRILEEGFDSRHIRWGGYKKHEIVGYRNEDEFYKKFHAYSYRITLREAQREGTGASVRLRRRLIEVELARKSREIYDELLAELQVEVDRKRVKVKNVLALVTKLQQITGGYLQSEEGPVTIGCEKIEALHRIIRSLPSRTRFIVICRFIWEIEAVAAFLRRMNYKVAVVRGGQSYDGKFKEDCLVLQVQSGIAVDMAAADAAILYSTDYSYLNFTQARFRILSYGKREAQYFFLLANNTVDGLIYQAITKKQNLAKLVCDTYRNRKR